MEFLAPHGHVTVCLKLIQINLLNHQLLRISLFLYSPVCGNIWCQVNVSGILLNVELVNLVAVSLCIVSIIKIYTFRVITVYHRLNIS